MAALFLLVLIPAAIALFVLAMRESNHVADRQDKEVTR